MNDIYQRSASGSPSFQHLIDEQEKLYVLLEQFIRATQKLVIQALEAESKSRNELNSMPVEQACELLALVNRFPESHRALVKGENEQDSRSDLQEQWQDAQMRH